MARHAQREILLFCSAGRERKNIIIDIYYYIIIILFSGKCTATCAMR